MSKFDEIFSPANKSKPTGMLIDITADCQFCDEEAIEVMNYPNEKLLVWKCAAGHRSYIENFQLG